MWDHSTYVHTMKSPHCGIFPSMIYVTFIHRLPDPISVYVHVLKKPCLGMIPLNPLLCLGFEVGNTTAGEDMKTREECAEKVMQCNHKSVCPVLAEEDLEGGVLLWALGEGKSCL